MEMSGVGDQSQLVLTQSCNIYIVLSILQNFISVIVKVSTENATCK